jgi:hypothetical protein
MTLAPGDLAVLQTPEADTILSSATPARFAYVSPDGTPRVVPIWFHWNGNRLVFGTTPGSPKLAALEANPAIAVTIDTIVWPYQALMIRGRGEIDMVDGIVPEYELSAQRYFGPVQGPAWIDQIRPRYQQMARITLTPTWAWLLDYGERPEPR